ncbi:GGDEF domain-containing protein [Actinoplanes solisilvae]|uniref:GGDEF domain-containing protein n=1 Tax=Actinoplanes solisilvae TaxID=2486853 RepID=UPI0013E3DCB6|nr:GGDEF domain-containing protein [Actinoplanes solisilvae]
MKRAVAGWQLVLAAAPLIIASYYLLLGAHAGWALALFMTANLATAAGSLIAVRRNPTLRPILFLLAAAGGSIVFGDVFYYLVEAPYPSLGDVGYFLSYPLTAAGLLIVVRRRTPGWDAASAIDAAIVAVGSGYVIFALVIAPTMAIDATNLVRLVSVSYPVGDLMLIVVGARLLLGAGPRTTPLRMIGICLVLKLTADTVYSVTVLDGTYHNGNLLDAFWMSAGFLMAATVLHPDLRRLVEPAAAVTPDASAGRLTVLAIAAVVAPTVMTVQYLRGVNPHVLIAGLVCNVLFLLVIGRMAGLVRAQRHAAITDGLTGLRSRRFFEQTMLAESARSARSGDELSLLLLDIDHFKSVNDTYGHQGGDRVLVEVARRLTGVVRPHDLVARYGGEEFAVLLPGAGLDIAREVAERVRQGIADVPIGVGEDRTHRVTVSVGVSVCVPGEDLVLAADRALYRAKDAGRDRVAYSVTIERDSLARSAAHTT